MTKEIESLLEYLKYSKELTINPFGLGKASCNNNCKFCIISNRMVKGNVPIEYFKETTNNTKKWLNKYLYDLPEDLTITFFFVAGELFYMGKEYFDLYKETAKELYDIVTKRYTNIKFNLQSNLLLDIEHLDEFINLCKYINKLSNNICITTSFDLYGRFNTKEQIELWYKNLSFLQQSLNRKIMVEMILTNQAIEKYIKEGSKELDEVLSNPHAYDVSFEDFILNNLDNKELYPTTNNLVAFYKQIKDKYPNHNVLSFYRNRMPTKYIDSKPRNECILIQFSDKPFSNEYTHTDEDLRIVNKNCIGGILSNLTIYPKEEMLQFIPKNNEGLYCLGNKQEVNDYFNNKLGCNFCKYKLYCKSKCFIQSIVAAKPQKCQLKEIFKLFDNE